MANGSDPVVVIGAGQAGFQVATSLRDHRYEGPVTIVGDEHMIPYQRPPLSKAFLTACTGGDTLYLRPHQFYEDRDLHLRIGDPALHIDRRAQCVRLRSGTEIRYSHLVLATGARARPLPVPGTDTDEVFYLRSHGDAQRMRVALLSQRRNVVIVGGGFIGMEVAAVAAKLNHRVTVIETLGRVMERNVAAPISAHVVSRHISHETAILLRRSVVAIHAPGGHVRSVELDTGEKIRADLVVVGIGVVPNTELATAAGLADIDGIAVTDQLLTADPRISAIGDCASYPSLHRGGRRTRLESVQNATDHARLVAARIAGVSRDQHYSAVPWFWTEQFDMKIQIAGLSPAAEGPTVVTGDPSDGKFSVFRFSGDELSCVESVNRSADHMFARKVLSGQYPLPRANDVSAPEFTLKEFCTGRLLTT